MVEVLVAFFFVKTRTVGYMTPLTSLAQLKNEKQ